MKITDSALREALGRRRWRWWACKPLIFIIMLFCAFVTFPIWLWFFGGMWLWLLGTITR